MGINSEVDVQQRLEWPTIGHQPGGWCPACNMIVDAQHVIDAQHLKNMTALKTKNLQLKISKQEILHDVNLEVESGDFVFITGHNGAGKSLFLKAVLGLLNEKKGEIEIFGKENSADVVAQNVGYVPQYTEIDRDFPITVEEMIELECDNDRCADPKNHLEILNAAHIIKKKISDLSGGEFQKAIIARALVKMPKILFLDEPINNLDSKSQAALFELLKHLQLDHGMTVFVIIHDHTILESYEGRIFLFENKVVREISKSDLH
jgi:zinc transport system ATP-binding protein